MRKPNSSTDSLSQTLYGELRQLARRQLDGERRDHTLQATALVNEVYLKLKPNRVAEGWKSESQFLRAAAEAMRRILVDHARSRMAQKRGGGRFGQALPEIAVELPFPAAEVISVHEALDTLEKEDPLKAELVKLRVFAGMSHREAAEALGLPKSSADRHWAYAKVRLMALMQIREHAAVKE